MRGASTAGLCATSILLALPTTLASAQPQELLALYGAPGDYGPAGSPSDSGLNSLQDEFQELAEAIPGLPGDDYPVFSQPPDTSFTCGDKIEGYYGDPEADCQTFHICANDGVGGLLKYSFLCPNGTIFNQQYFICDWWFNVDCSQVEDFYYLNEEVAAAAVAATAAQNLINGEAITFPSQPSQGSGVVPGQLDFGIDPRFGSLKEAEQERGGNRLGDNIFSLGDSFPVDRIPVQFKGSPPPPAETQTEASFSFRPSIKLYLKSRAGRAGRNPFGGRGGVFRRKKKFTSSPRLFTSVMKI